MKTKDLIQELFIQKRFAMVGVSRNSREFSRNLFGELTSRGYDVIPVNPSAKEIGGKTCYRTAKEIQPPVTKALIMTHASMIEQVLLDCADAGITLVWVYGISGSRDISVGAIDICKERGIALVPGYCPYMFMPASSFFHRMHGYALKAFGDYPR